MVSREALIVTAAATAISGLALWTAFKPGKPQVDVEEELEHKREEGKNNLILQLLDLGNIAGNRKGQVMPGVKISLDGRSSLTDSNGSVEWRQLSPGDHEIKIVNADIHDKELITHDGFMFQGEVTETLHVALDGSSRTEQVSIHEVAIEQEVGEELEFEINVSVEE